MPTRESDSLPASASGTRTFCSRVSTSSCWRAQFKDNLSIVWGRHTLKVGGEWMHTFNDQVFRGFFTGRYLFDSVTGFLRYASAPAPGGFGPNALGCSDGSYVTMPASCPAGTLPTAGPLLTFLQGAGPTGLATDAAGASTITNDEFSLFVQDRWQLLPNVSLQYGLRWDAQRMPETVDPTTTAFAAFLGDPRFPSDGTIPSQWAMIQPRVGATWDVGGERQVGRPGERRPLLRPAEHAQSGRQRHDQRSAATDHFREHRQPPAIRRRRANLAGRGHAHAAAARVVPAVLGHPRVRPRLREPAHLYVHGRLRAGARPERVGLCGLHLRARPQSHAVPELQPVGSGLLRPGVRAPATSIPTPARRRSARSWAR